ncbi:RNA-directed DNA polymerase from mobile element jockey [Eumeta japonica]|uniref:RNA-directed DNA polymerase from mobile element jockey n=1 Tax=Eumeta variegata TaxID=151549 RepID=A0A4C1T1Z8_EUMVA|nr:RNA-directed DNA polymerase from mobile element jockey [Eumeta japonica]
MRTLPSIHTVGDDVRVFVHADPNSLYQLQILQNNICRKASNAPWYVRNYIFHKDLELPTISKYTQDISKKIFDLAANHPNPLIQPAVSYEAPPTPVHPKATECSLRPTRFHSIHL